MSDSKYLAAYLQPKALVANVDAKSASQIPPSKAIHRVGLDGRVNQVETKLDVIISCQVNVWILWFVHNHPDVTALDTTNK